MNSEQGTELIELAKQRKLTLTVGHVFRFNNAVNFVRNSLKKGDFGRPYMLKLVWTNLEPVYPERDVIFDLAPHPFDMVEFLFGRNIEEVSCIGQCYRQKHIEVAFINAKLDNILIDIEVSWVTPKKERSLVMVCSEATVFVDCTRQRITIYNNEKAAYQEVDLVPNNTIQDELREFLRCTESRGISIVDAEVGLNTIKVLEKTKLAMESGTVIKVGV
jgi:predicted dehydrogenase